MSDAIIVEGSTVEEALAIAAERLKVDLDELEHSVLEEAGKSVFGLRGKPARVRAWKAGSGGGELEDESAEEEEDVPPDAILIAGDLPEVSAAPLPAGAAASVPEPGNEVEQPELSEDEIDEIADAAVEVIKGILKPFGLSATIEEYEGDEGEIILDVVGDDLALLIGRHGKTLEALQAVVVSATNRKVDKRHPVVVDVEGYRARRREKLVEIARRTAEKVGRTGRPAALRPMTAFERRVIHVALRGDKRVQTQSDGEEPYRKVVVSPK